MVLNGTPKRRTMADTLKRPLLWVWIKRFYGKGFYTYSDAIVTTFSGFLVWVIVREVNNGLVYIPNVECIYN